MEPAAVLTVFSLLCSWGLTVSQASIVNVRWKGRLGCYELQRMKLRGITTGGDIGVSGRVRR